jgi:hypothetical protein
MNLTIMPNICQEEPPNPKMGIFMEGIMFSDLISVKQGLIPNFIFVLSKTMNDFIWIVEQYPKWHAKLNILSPSECF